MTSCLTIEEFSELTKFYVKVLKRIDSNDYIGTDTDVVISLISETISAIDNAYEELAH